MALVNMTLFSTCLNMDVEIEVYLPEARRGMEELHPDKKYPVIYCLHGYRDNYMSWVTKSTLLLEARKHECIIVMPDVRNSFYTNGKNGFNYYDYISKELPVKIANFFPVSTRKEDTFIMGASMGGYGAFLIAMNNPDRYHAAYSFSGPLALKYKNGSVFDFDSCMSRQVMGAMGSQEEFYDSDYYLMNTVKKFDEYSGDKPRLKAVCGKQDVLCYAYNEQFMKEVCENTSVKILYETSDGAHDYYFWNQYIDDAFQFFGIE